MPATLVAGLSASYEAANRTNISDQWRRFAPHIGKVPGQSGGDTFGVCSNGGPDRGRFDYLSGVAVASPDGLPDGFRTVPLDARRYAVFAHEAHVSALPATLDAISTRWAPSCGLKLARGAPTFERYTPEFDPATGLGGMEVWVPLEA